LKLIDLIVSRALVLIVLFVCLSVSNHAHFGLW
jgi:hypothetical protein